MDQVLPLIRLVGGECRAVMAPGLRGEANDLRELATRFRTVFADIVEPYVRGSLEAALGNNDGAEHFHSILRKNEREPEEEAEVVEEAEMVEEAEVVEEPEPVEDPEAEEELEPAQEPEAPEPTDEQQDEAEQETEDAEESGLTEASKRKTESHRMKRG
jgi:hypothetical protein